MPLVLQCQLLAPQPDASACEGVAYWWKGRLPGRVLAGRPPAGARTGGRSPSKHSTRETSLPPISHALASTCVRLRGKELALEHERHGYCLLSYSEEARNVL